jgi:hypothetical protein
MCNTIHILEYITHKYKQSELVDGIREKLKEYAQNLPTIDVLYCGSYGGYGYSRTFNELFVVVAQHYVNNPVANENDNENNGTDSEEEPELPPGLGVPSVPQSIVNMVMKNIANEDKLGHVTNRGLLVWSSVGSGKTICAAGVMDAFLDSGRDIIFASSLDALASNPPSKFHEGAMRIFPRFQTNKYVVKDEAETMANIARAFEKVRFLSFAKLSNRVKKWEQMEGGGGVDGSNVVNFAIDSNNDSTYDMDITGGCGCGSKTLLFGGRQAAGRGRISSKKSTVDEDETENETSAQDKLCRTCDPYANNTKHCVAKFIQTRTKHDT